MEKPASTKPSEWVDRYGDYLFRFAMLRLRDRSTAEDLVQETFLAALKGRGSFSGNSSESTWLVGILKHKIMDHFRHQAREAPLEDGDLREQPDPSSFDRSGHWASGPTDWGGNPADLYREKKFLDQPAPSSCPSSGIWTITAWGASARSPTATLRSPHGGASPRHGAWRKRSVPYSPLGASQGADDFAGKESFPGRRNRIDRRCSSFLPVFCV